MAERSTDLRLRLTKRKLKEEMIRLENSMQRRDATNSDLQHFHISADI